MTGEKTLRLLTWVSCCWCFSYCCCCYCYCCVREPCKLCTRAGKKKLNQKPIPNSNYSRGKRQTGQHVKKSKAQPTGRDPESACLSPGHIQSAIYDEIKFGKKKVFSLPFLLITGMLEKPNRQFD